jgi:hypothetical protein
MSPMASRVLAFLCGLMAFTLTNTLKRLAL